MTEIDEKSLEAENQESQTAEPGKEEDSYSLPLSARSGSQWIPPHVLRSSSGSGPTAEAKLPEPGFTAAAWKESAFCTLFLLAFGLLVAYLPLLGVVASLFMPLLLAKLLLRRGLVLSLLALLLAFAADAFLLGLPSAASIFLQYGSMGLVFGLCYRKKKSGVLSLFLAALCCFLGHTFSIGLSFLQDGLSLTEFWPLMEQAYGESLRSLAQASGMVSTVNLDAFVEYGLSLLHRLLLPMNLLSAVVSAWFCYLLSSAVLRRQGYQIPRMPAFLTWHIDWRFSWGLILGLLFMFLARFFPYSWMESLGSVLSLCFGLVLALCGLSFLLWTMKTLRFPGLLRFCLVAFLLIFLNVGVFILAFLAVLDDMKSLRSRIIEKAHSREE